MGRTERSIARFQSEASLALYLGMATLDSSSGKFRGSKATKHVNARAKTAMMAAVDHHRKRVPQSQCYYERKRAEGKKHNQAIRALGRHLCRVIFKMLSQERLNRIDHKQRGKIKRSVARIGGDDEQPALSFDLEPF